jgi:hypothetical protein
MSKKCPIRSEELSHFPIEDSSSAASMNRANCNLLIFFGSHLSGLSQVGAALITALKIDQPVIELL